MNEIKTKIIQEDVYEQVKIGTQPKTVYLSDDGKEWESEQSAKIRNREILREYEESKRQQIIKELEEKMCIKRIENDIWESGEGFLFKVTCLEDINQYERLQFIHESSPKYYKDWAEKNRGRWALAEYSDGGDYKSDYYYIEVDEYIDELNKNIDMIKEHVQSVMKD